MKIGIVTLFVNVNYGANLQAYALNSYIKSLGYDCKLVNYTAFPDGVKLHRWLFASWKNDEKKSVLSKIKLATALVLSAPWKWKKLQKFETFRKKNTSLTKQCFNQNDISNLHLDTIVCGSDQIWNPDITKGLNPIYFGRIDGVSKRIAYAASIGKNALDNELEMTLREWTMDMDSCSVREIQSAEYLEKLIGRKVASVCDPVFLLNKSEYASIAKSPFKGKYVLLYSVVHNDSLTMIAERFAQKHNMQLFEICSGPIRHSKHRQYCALGPDEFIGAIMDAEIVISNSFHGIALSIKFEKNFYAFENSNRPGRITNLLQMVGLESQIINDYPLGTYEIDYKYVNDRLREYVEYSKLYLQQSLSGSKRPVVNDSCVGCSACFSVCENDAIRMYPDEKGFLRGLVDAQKCIECHLCEKVCQVLQPQNKKDINAVYAFKAEDDLRRESASGGAFAAIAKSILLEHGVVYGASIDNLFRVKHIRVDSIDDLSKLQGSKYVQSNLENVFRQMTTDLRSGKVVLFSGTPCQVAGAIQFMSFLKVPLDRFITVDIICHGTPSSSVFLDFIKWLSLRKNKEIKKYRFRSKEISWRGNSCLVEFKDGTKLKNDRECSAFMNLYYSSNITRDECFQCRYAEAKRVSDITIGDFWGIEQTLLASIEDELGVSMVMVNTEKGKRILKSCNGESRECDLLTVKQPQLRQPTKRSDHEVAFWSEYRILGIDNVLKKYAGLNIPLKSKMKNVLFQMSKSYKSHNNV